MNAIEFRHLKFRYSDGKEDVLTDVNRSIPYGKICFLTGRTGIGKTTLLKILTRVIPEDVPGTVSGDVIVAGESIARRSVGEMAEKIGFVMQDPETQIFHEEVEDEILFGMENAGFPKGEAFAIKDEILCEIGLRREEKTRTLSGGQKEVLIARSVMAMGRDILVLDEPLANLDQVNALRFLRLLKNLSRRGKAILICEHRSSLVLPFADEVFHLEGGALVDGIGEDEGPLDFSVASKKEEGEALLIGRGIEKSFGERKVLNGVDISLKRGMVTALLGMNGGGKSTLLNILSGQMRAEGGEIQTPFLPGVRRGGGKWFSNVAVVFQNPTYSLFCSTVQKELLFRVPEAEYALLLGRRFGLGPLMERHPQSLSEGEKRKLSIACALAKKPSLLFLDEPTVGQDRKSLKHLLSVLREEIDHRGMGVLMATHDEPACLALADEAYELVGGKASHPPSIEGYFQHLREEGLRWSEG